MTINLRPVEEDDLPFIHRLTSDPHSTGEFQWYGFQSPHRLREGVLRGAGFRAGQRRDGVLYSVIRSDLG
ncbi:hypothetical protein [Nonomuraea sp. NPDC049709]|uniref:hypothetical protein n=1 Tax=Nonomuraea sp. NPDC049709 TaxID=3154736 RepID=UPI00343BA389